MLPLPQSTTIPALFLVPSTTLSGHGFRTGSSGKNNIRNSGSRNRSALSTLRVVPGGRKDVSLCLHAFRKRGRTMTAGKEALKKYGWQIRIQRIGRRQQTSPKGIRLIAFPRAESLAFLCGSRNMCIIVVQQVLRNCLITSGAILEVAVSTRKAR